MLINTIYYLSIHPSIIYSCLSFAGLQQATLCKARYTLGKFITGLAHRNKHSHAHIYTHGQFQSHRLSYPNGYVFGRWEDLERNYTENMQTPHTAPATNSPATESPQPAGKFKHTTCVTVLTTAESAN